MEIIKNTAIAAVIIAAAVFIRISDEHSKERTAAVSAIYGAEHCVQSGITFEDAAKTAFDAWEARYGF